MTAPATLVRKRRLLEPALDHEALFDDAVNWIRRWGHLRWSDHNVHDPGITALEILCYALTDLSYRASYPVADLLASETENEQRMRERFATARDILPTRPITLADYRKLLIDLPGVKNAWLRPAVETYYADIVDGELLREAPADMTGIVRVDLRGLYQVLLEFMDDVTTAARRDEIRDAALHTLHENRNLCEDFVDVRRVPTQNYAVCAELELAPDADIARVHAEILFRVQEYLSPPVRQYTLDEMLTRTGPDGTPYTAAEVFNGPILRHGFIDDAELARAELRSEIRLSDVISVVMDITGVRAIRDIVVTLAGDTRPLEQKWVLRVPEGTKPLLAREASRLVFYKRNMPFVARAEDVAPHWDRMAAAATASVETAADFDLPVPVGTFRSPGDYVSFQRHFPAVYGLGDAGVVDADRRDVRRRVLAYQLKAFLLFFDQLMADFSAQLSHAGDLFSLDPEQLRTYFHQRVDLPDVDRLYPAGDVVELISATIDDADLQVARRNRFLDHLIARYGERFHELAAIMQSEFRSPPASMVRFKTEFLADYPRISSERALGYNYTLRDDEALWPSENISGLERRLARLLGIRNHMRRNLGTVAYDTYTEIDSTPGDEFRFRIRRRDADKILLSSSTNYPTRAAALEEMRRAIAAASVPSGYQRAVDTDGRHYFNIIDETGEVIARRIEYFETPELMEEAIAELIVYLREHYSDEGMYLIENILLRPAAATHPFLPICPDPNCTECADADPYSYRIHVILPAYAGRFADMDFRRWVEQVIREETPAHIAPKVCWLSPEDMAEFERLYRDWIYLKAGRETAGRVAKITAFIEKLYSVKSTYPTQRLKACDAGETLDKFILGQTALGSQET